MLEHLETAGSDKAVKRDADAAHDAAGDGLKEAHKRCDHGEDDAGKCSAPDTDRGSIAGDGDCSDGLTVSGVGASAEERADKGTDTIAQKGIGQTRIFEKVDADDRA